MSNIINNANQRLKAVKDMIVGKVQDPNSLPWDPDSTSFPLRKDLTISPGGIVDSAWVWGKDDYRGRLNLLTPTRIKAAASQIRTGESARVDLPLNVPEVPAFGRAPFKHEKKVLRDGVAYDDVYSMNTQSGTQWDGFRHVAHYPSQTFYNNTKSSDFMGEVDNLKCSIHHWSEGAFSGRGVLLDYRAYTESQGITYDSSTSHAISYSDLEACGKHQGLDIRPASQGGDIQIGDILLIRSGWVQDYNNRTKEENAALARHKNETEGPKQRLVGVKQEQVMINWLHDCYFAAVAGDSPTFEVWPSVDKYYLHDYLLALWGVPIGEMLDLEKVSELAKKNGRWTFFFTSAPANCVGGVASHVNGTVIF